MWADILEFLSQITELINKLPENTDSYWERLILWIIITWLELKVVALDIAWGIAEQILSALGLGDHLQTAWAAVPSEIASVFNYLRIPESINLVMTAYLTRFILGLLP